MPKIKCSCENEFQDSKYGNKVRIATPIKKGETIKGKCTVCGNITDTLKSA